jgi:hypothetical protein
MCGGGEDLPAGERKRAFMVPDKEAGFSASRGIGAISGTGDNGFTWMASIQEGSCYAFRDPRPFVLIPTKSSVEELMEFSKRMCYRGLRYRDTTSAMEDREPRICISS